MEIKTLKGTLVVIRKIYEYDFLEINLCKYDNAAEEALYTLVVLKDADIVRSNIKMFSSLRNNEKFNDFIECFSQNSNLYIIFRYLKEFSINYENISELKLMEKFDFIKQLLSLIVILDMPKEILYDVLSINNINRDASGKVYFNYFLLGVDRYENIQEKDVVKKIGQIITNSFSYEIIKDSVKGLRDFVYACESEQYTHIIDIYSNFVRLNENFIDSLNHLEMKPEGKIKRFIRRVIEIFNKIKPMLLILAVCIGVVYLIVTYTRADKSKQLVNIKSIGTEKY